MCVAIYGALKSWCDSFDLPENAPKSMVEGVRAQWTFFFKAAILTSNGRVNTVVTKDTNKDRVKVLIRCMLAH